MSTRVAVQRPGPAGRAAPAEPVAAAQRVVAEPGRPLDGDVRRSMESDLGHDFSAVRVHTDEAAAAAADRLDAAAFTLGSHVVFGPGRYRPHTPAGQEVLRHELAHVVQQRELGPAPAAGDTAVALGEVDSPAERAARSGDARGAVSLSGPVIQRAPKGAAATPHLTDVEVHQAGQAQTVRWKWSAGSGNADGSARCSTGKGHCCVDPAMGPETTACSHKDSHVTDSNYTPEGDFTVQKLVNDTNVHPAFWTEFVSARGIALHEYTPVDGTPLSHGCVRLDQAAARIIFNGARPGVTRVHVIGLPTPLCSNPQLQAEWVADYATAGARPRDGESREARDQRRARAEERRALRSAHGVDEAGLDAELVSAGSPPTAGSVASRVPRCVGGSTVEEREVAAAPAAVVPATPKLVGFKKSLYDAADAAKAKVVASTFGTALWDQARARAQGTANPDFDDRPLYWDRLRATAVIRDWDPKWLTTSGGRRRPVNPDDRRRAVAPVLEAFERSSRGLDTYAFPAPGTTGSALPGSSQNPKRIVIGGFDPFGGSMGSQVQANPSASAVLALDGLALQNGAVHGRVEGVVFPVRFADFNAGIVENAMRPHIVGPPRAHLVMTISRGSAFQMEQLAAGRRSDDFADNLGFNPNPTPAGTPGTTAPRRRLAGPRIPGGTASDPEFLATTVPESTQREMRRALGRTTTTAPLAAETTVEDVATPTETDAANLRTRVAPRTDVPTGGGTVAVSGPGGAFLSNEIFYRTSRMERSTRVAGQATANVPIIHLHVPALDPAHPDAGRADVVRRVRAMIEAALPTL